jgi:hypothetical protein
MIADASYQAVKRWRLRFFLFYHFSPAMVKSSVKI